MSINLKIIAILVVFVLSPFPFLKCEAADTKIGAGFHAGIAVDKNKSGVVTAMRKTRRIIKEINNRPAFEVYREWADGALDDVKPAESQAIWSRSFALVRVYNLAGNDVGEKVVVPIKVNPDFSMITGADVSKGEHLMGNLTSAMAVFGQ